MHRIFVDFATHKDFAYPYKNYEDFVVLEYIKSTLVFLSSKEHSTSYIIKNAKYLSKIIEKKDI